MALSDIAICLGLLAQLGYLPLNWQPNPGNLPVSSTDANAQLSAAYSPPAGSFSWQPGYPSQLRRFWQGGQPGLILRGAVMAFESNQGLAMDGTAGPGVWQALLFIGLRGWPVNVIARRPQRLIVGNILVIAGGALTYLLLRDIVHWRPDAIGAACGELEKFRLARTILQVNQ